MFNLPEKTINPVPDSSKKALKLGVGGSIILLIIRGLAIADSGHGGMMKPMGQLLITVIVLIVSGIGCIGIALGQFLDAKTRRGSFLTLFYGLLPVITFVVILGFIRYIMNIGFA